MMSAPGLAQGTAPLDVASAAAAIARAADADSKSTGRPCRLQDQTAVQTFLSSLLSGCSVYAASVAAGFSDAGVRRWLKLGTVAGSGGVYADLAAAVATARELRETLTGAPVVTPSEVAVRVPDAVTAAPPAPSRWLLPRC